MAGIRKSTARGTRKRRPRTKRQRPEINFSNVDPRLIESESQGSEIGEKFPPEIPGEHEHTAPPQTQWPI